MAESFVAYWGLRFRRERLSQKQISDIISIGPNRLKFFYDHVDQALSAPPASRSLLLESSPQSPDEVVQLKELPGTETGTFMPLSREELDEMAADYVAEADYLASIGML